MQTTVRSASSAFGCVNPKLAARPGSSLASENLGLLHSAEVFVQPPQDLFDEVRPVR